MRRRGGRERSRPGRCRPGIWGWWLWPGPRPKPRRTLYQGAQGESPTTARLWGSAISVQRREGKDSTSRQSLHLPHFPINHMKDHTINTQKLWHAKGNSDYPSSNISWTNPLIPRLIAVTPIAKPNIKRLKLRAVRLIYWLSVKQLFVIKKNCVLYIHFRSLKISCLTLEELQGQ